jgi:hypothetical protein
MYLKQTNLLSLIRQGALVYTILLYFTVCTVPMIASTVLIVLLMMGAEGTRNMYSNLAVKNKYDCLKLHHVGYLIK